MNDVSISYSGKDEPEKYAVENAFFTLCEGEALGLVGESGSGKSTLGNAIIRSLEPPGRITAGNIFLDDQDITAISDEDFNQNVRWKKIAMVFQGAMNSLDPVFSIEDQFKEIFTQHLKKKNYDRQLIENSLREVNLDISILKQYPHELSGGMKQRVIIAMALILNPKILIADEPTTALDVLIQAQIINLLKKLKIEEKKTILLITHDFGIVSELADWIAVMYAGQIVELNYLDEIYFNPRHPYTQMLISNTPKFGSTFKENKQLSITSIDSEIPKLGCPYYGKCQFAKEICKQNPPLTKINNGYVKCWLYEK